MTAGAHPVLRTPEERFERLGDFRYEPRYASVSGIRMHYLDEGPSDGPAVLLLHGEPTWSYLYRKVIPRLVEAGMRAIAPDFIGFGRSDKLVRQSDYSYRLHIETVTTLIDALDLSGLTLFGQDWGGLVGLRLVVNMPNRFDRVIVANTGLPSASLRLSDAFLQWREYSQKVPEFLPGKIVRKSCLTTVSPEVEAAYDAPFPDDSYKAGARVFPMLVPIDATDPESAANEAAWSSLEKWTKPLLTAFSDGDPITAGGEKVFQRRVPGARDQNHVTIHGAGHFLQEDKGEEVGDTIVGFVRRTLT